jgi:UDP-glucose 6-dehydrogenase
MIDDNTFLNKPNFTKMVENKVLDTKQSYMDAVVDLCEKLDIDPIDVKKFIVIRLI